jgi:hypothetical protein
VSERNDLKDTIERMHAALRQDSEAAEPIHGDGVTAQMIHTLRKRIDSRDEMIRLLREEIACRDRTIGLLREECEALRGAIELLDSPPSQSAADAMLAALRRCRDAISATNAAAPCPRSFSAHLQAGDKRSLSSMSIVRFKMSCICSKVNTSHSICRISRILPVQRAFSVRPCTSPRR